MLLSFWTKARGMLCYWMCVGLPDWLDILPLLWTTVQEREELEDLTLYICIGCQVGRFQAEESAWALSSESESRPPLCGGCGWGRSASNTSYSSAASQAAEGETCFQGLFLGELQSLVFSGECSKTTRLWESGFFLNFFPLWTLYVWGTTNPCTYPVLLVTATVALSPWSNLDQIKQEEMMQQ